MSLAGIEAAIVNGTNNLLTSVLAQIQSSLQPKLDQSGVVLNNIDVNFTALTNQTSGVVAKANIILDKFSAIVDDVDRMSKQVEQIVNLLFIVVIAVMVAIFFSFILWFFRHVWPILRGWTARPRSFDELVRELTVSRITST